MEEHSITGRFEGQTTEFKYRLESFEKDLLGVKQQLQYYVSAKENDLQLKNIQTTVNRIELEIQDAKNRVDQVNKQLTTQEIEMQKQSSELRDSLSRLQIRILCGTVSTILTIFTSVLIGYLTHLIH